MALAEAFGCTLRSLIPESPCASPSRPWRLPDSRCRGELSGVRVSDYVEDTCYGGNGKSEKNIVDKMSGLSKDRRSLAVAVMARLRDQSHVLMEPHPTATGWGFFT